MFIFINIVLSIIALLMVRFIVKKSPPASWDELAQVSVGMGVFFSLIPIVNGGVILFCLILGIKHLPLYKRIFNNDRDWFDIIFFIKRDK